MMIARNRIWSWLGPGPFQQITADLTDFVPEPWIGPETAP
jgi:hypothetical protein